MRDLGRMRDGVAEHPLERVPWGRCRFRTPCRLLRPGVSRSDREAAGRRRSPWRPRPSRRMVARPASRSRRRPGGGTGPFRGCREARGHRAIPVFPRQPHGRAPDRADRPPRRAMEARRCRVGREAGGRHLRDRRWDVSEHEVGNADRLRRGGRSDARGSGAGRPIRARAAGNPPRRRAGRLGPSASFVRDGFLTANAVNPCVLPARGGAPRRLSCDRCGYGPWGSIARPALTASSTAARSAC